MMAIPLKPYRDERTGWGLARGCPNPISFKTRKACGIFKEFQHCVYISPPSLDYSLQGALSEGLGFPVVPAVLVGSKMEVLAASRDNDKGLALVRN